MYDGTGGAVYVCVHSHVGNAVHMEVRGQLVGTGSFLPLWGFQGLNAGVRHGSNSFNLPRQLVDSRLCIS